MEQPTCIPWQPTSSSRSRKCVEVSEKFVGQTSLYVPAQRITCSRQPDSEKSLTFMQRNVQVMPQSLSAQHRGLSRLRYKFALLVTLASILLILDCILVFQVFFRYQVHNQRIHAPPTLISAPAVVYPRQVVLLHLAHFSASSHVLLWRDGEDHVRLDTDSSLVQVSSTGEATVLLLVEDTWGTGLHFIEAEDIEAHYIVSTTIQVIDSCPTS